MMQALKKWDPIVLLLGMILSVAGALLIFDAGYARSLRDGYGVLPREFVSQFAAMFVAMVAGIFISKWPVDKLFHASKWIFVATLVLVLGLFTPLGYEMGGSRSWYKLGPFTVQPGEFAKIAVALYLGVVLSTRKAWPTNIKRQKSFAMWLDNVAIKKLPRLVPALVAFGLVGIIAMDDLGTGAVAGFVAWTLLAVGGVTRKSMIVGTLFLGLCVFGAMKMESYRMDRFTAHAHRWDSGNMDDIGFQTVQAELGAANGGLIGVGPGAGRVKHIIAAPTTDFIPATIAEEFGFVGWAVVVGLLGTLTYRLFWLSGKAPTRYGRLVLAGIASWIGIQSVVNLLMANGTLPAIGIPLPFVSSGGSSLLALWIGLGVSQIAMQPVAARAAQEDEDEASRDRRRHGRARLSRA